MTIVNLFAALLLPAILIASTLARQDAAAAQDVLSLMTPVEPRADILDTLVAMTESERQQICSACPDCSVCTTLRMRAADASRGYHKLEIHMLNTDPSPENRLKRIVDLTKPARYHCGKCPTCYCYYRAWRRG